MTQFINPPGEPYPVGTKVYMAYFQRETRSSPTGRLLEENVWRENIPVIVTKVYNTVIRGDHLRYSYTVTMLDGTIVRVAGRQLSLTKVYRHEEAR